MLRRRRPQRVDPMEAFLKALVLTRSTVDGSSSAAQQLDQMIELTTDLIKEAETDEHAWDVVEAAIERSYQSVSHD